MTRLRFSTLVAAVIAFAQPGTSVYAQDFAVELLAGRAKHDASFGLFLPDVDEDDTSYGIRGTYQITRHWGLDLSYNDFGKAKGTSRDDAGETTDFSLEGSAIELNVNGRLFLGDRLALVARIGVSRYDSERSIGATSDDDDGYTLGIGAGAQFQFTDRFFSGLDYSYRDLSGGSIDQIDFDNYDLTNLTLSLGYRF
ncbi:MAG: porin family protein [Gammaproteobacteria bacterium]|jgi:OOP family OmpA-OmpF porin